MEKKNLAPTAEMVGISMAETMLTATNKASERALENMMTVKVRQCEMLGRICSGADAYAWVVMGRLKG